jgi:hypothetical protein
MPNKRIPHFKTDEEAAEFWDTHDFAEYWDDTVRVDDVTFGPNPFKLVKEPSPPQRKPPSPRRTSR